MIEEAEPERGACRDPPAGVTGVQHLRHEERDGRAGDDLRRHRAEEVADSDEDRRERGAERSEELRAVVAAELACDHRRQQHDRGVQERGNHCEAEAAGAEERLAHAIQERRDRRVVDVAPREVPPLREVVELVAVIAVDRRRREMEDRGERRNQRRVHSATKLFATSSITVALATASSISLPS